MQTVTLTEGNDAWTTSPASEIVYGLGGDDIITANNTTDVYDHTFYGGKGTDILTGALGDDVLVAGGGVTDDQLYGGAGEDKLYGSKGANILSGGAGDDKIWLGQSYQDSDGEADTVVLETNEDGNGQFDRVFGFGEEDMFQFADVTGAGDDTIHITRIDENVSNAVRVHWEYEDESGNTVENIVSFAGIGMDDLQASNFDGAVFDLAFDFL